MPEVLGAFNFAQTSLCVLYPSLQSPLSRKKDALFTQLLCKAMMFDFQSFAFASVMLQGLSQEKSNWVVMLLLAYASQVEGDVMTGGMGGVWGHPQPEINC